MLAACSVARWTRQLTAHGLESLRAQPQHAARATAIWRHNTQQEAQTPQRDCARLQFALVHIGVQSAETQKCQETHTARRLRQAAVCTCVHRCRVQRHMSANTDTAKGLHQTAVWTCAGCAVQKCSMSAQASAPPPPPHPSSDLQCRATAQLLQIMES